MALTKKHEDRLLSEGFAQVRATVLIEDAVMAAEIAKAESDDASFAVLQPFRIGAYQLGSNYIDHRHVKIVVCQLDGEAEATVKALVHSPRVRHLYEGTGATLAEKLDDTLRNGAQFHGMELIQPLPKYQFDTRLRLFPLTGGKATNSVFFYRINPAVSDLALR